MSDNFADHAAAIADLPRWHPNPRVQDAIRRIRAHGWCVTAVSENCAPSREDGELASDCEAPEAAFAYTTGMAVHNVPELLIYGLDAMSAAVVLNQFGELLHTYSWQELLDRRIRLTLDTVALQTRIIEAVDKSDMAVTSFLFPDAPALQVVWADDLGSFPWDADYHLDPVRQPVKGVPTALSEAAPPRGVRVITHDSDGRMKRRKPRRPKAG